MTGPSARRPAVAGAFYAADAAELARQVEACFTDARGPGELPVRHRSSRRTLVAAVVPHAGYPYSGPIAAHVYDRVARERAPRTVLVLGVDHHGRGRGGALSDRPWLTPLGPTAVDHELVRALAGGPIEIDEAAQAEEHSIEVQLPFLEYVLPKPEFVALQVPYGSLSFLEAVAARVRAACADRDVLILASSDFSHYIAAEEARRLDRLAIDAILAGEAARLYDVVQRERISMCGIAPTTVLLAALDGRALSARLLRWGHSGEVVPMPDVVGYAAITLEEPTGDRPPAK